MKLVGSKTSPYVRKARVILAERSLPFEFVEESAWTANTTVPRYNPLNKVPALVMDDGESIYDSRVICEYLDAISGGGLLPAEAAQRAHVRRFEALGDGIADAGITTFLERKREAPRQDPAWISRQLDKVNASFAALEAALARGAHVGGEKINMADIACACALFWCEFRMPELGVRAKHPKIQAWAERLEARPSFGTTRPPA
jgi:glutathione S-transferase